LAMAVFEARPFLDLGLGWREGVGQNLFIGVALGAAAALLAVLPGVAAGVARFQFTSPADVSWRGAAFLLVLLFCGAMGEELAFRGFVLQYLARGYGKWIAVLAIGLLFGALHKDNPGASWLSFANTALFGVLFGYALL